MKNSVSSRGFTSSAAACMRLRAQRFPKSLTRFTRAASQYTMEWNRRDYTGVRLCEKGNETVFKLFMSNTDLVSRDTMAQLINKFGPRRRIGLPRPDVESLSWYFSPADCATNAWTVVQTNCFHHRQFNVIRTVCWLATCWRSVCDSWLSCLH